MPVYHQDHKNDPQSHQHDQPGRDDNRGSQVANTIDLARTHAVGGSVGHLQAGGFINDSTSTRSIQLHHTQTPYVAPSFTCRILLKLDGSVCGSRSDKGTGVCLLHQNVISSPRLNNDRPGIAPCLVSQRYDTTAPILEDERNLGNLQDHSDVVSTSLDTRLRDPESHSYSEFPIEDPCDRCKKKKASRENTRYRWCDDCDLFCKVWDPLKCGAIQKGTDPSGAYISTGQCVRNRCYRGPRLLNLSHGVQWGEWFPGRPFGTAIPGSTSTNRAYIDLSVNN